MNSFEPAILRPLNLNPAQSMLKPLELTGATPSQHRHTPSRAGFRRPINSTPVRRCVTANRPSFDPFVGQKRCLFPSPKSKGATGERLTNKGARRTLNGSQLVSDRPRSWPSFLMDYCASLGCIFGWQQGSTERNETKKERRPIFLVPIAVPSPRVRLAGTKVGSILSASRE